MNSERYDKAYDSLADEFNRLRLEINDNVNFKNGEYLANCEDQLYHIRHNAICVTLGERLEVATDEASMRSTILGSDICSSLPKHIIDEIARIDIDERHHLNRTPDMVKIEKTVRSGYPRYDITWYEVTVVNKHAKETAMQVKFEKYRPGIRYLSNLFKAARLNCDMHLRAYVFSNDLSDWDFVMREHATSNKALESQCYNLCQNCNNFLYDVRKHVDNLNSVEAQKYVSILTRKRIIGSIDPFPNLNFNFDEMKRVIDSMPRTTPEMDDYQEKDVQDLVNEITDHIRENWKDVPQPFKKPNIRNVKKSFLLIEEMTSNEGFKHVSFDERSPTFHFLFLEDDIGPHKKDFLSSFQWVCEKFSETYVDDANILLTAAKEIFNMANLNEKFDNEIFNLKGTYMGDWKSDKKNLDKVLEPKTFHKKVVRLDHRQALNELVGINQKKNLKAQRDTLVAEGEYRKMKAMNLQDRGLKTMCLSEVKSQITWLNSLAEGKVKKIGNISPGRSADELFNHYLDYMSNMKAEKLSEYIRRVSEQVIFKSNSAGRGYHIIYTGNRRSWIILLPGGDVSHRDGEIRFFNLIVSDSYHESKFGRRSIFNNMSIKETAVGREQNFHASRWMSLNRNRWEHLSTVDPAPFVALLMTKSNMRFNEVPENFKELIFAYYYAAFGAQAKLSGLVDHFRYMIPGALAEKSALEKYVTEKLSPIFKTSGQVWLYEKLKTTTLKYLLQGRDLRMNQGIEIVDDAVTEETAGVTGALSSLFMKNVTWLKREVAMAEVYMAFHLTGKGYHNKFYRDINFLKTVMGNEVDFIENVKPLMKDGWDVNGVPLNEAGLIHKMERGGLWCKEAVMLSAKLSTQPAVVQPSTFKENVDRQNLTGNMLNEPKLTSTRSSLNSDKAVGKVYIYPPSQTVLQTTLDSISEEVADMKDFFKFNFANRVSNCFDDAYLTVFREGNTNTSEEEIRSIVDEVMTEYSDSMSKISNSQVPGKFFIKPFSYSDIFDTMNERLKHITDPRHIRIVMERFSQNMDMTRRPHVYKFLKEPSLLGGTMREKMSSISYSQQVEVWKAFKQLVRDEVNINLQECIEEWENSRLEKKNEKVHRFLTEESVLPNNSVLYHCLKNIDTVPECKIVPKGQRTEVDREIFVQNRSRYVYFVMEHIFQAICEMNPTEAITIPGDEKMVSLQKMFVRALKWKKNAAFHLDSKGKKVQEKRNIRFITGDLTKFSNHDTDQRLAAFANFASKGMSSKVGELLKQITRIPSSKIVYAPAGLCKGSLPSGDPSYEYFLKTGSTFPKFYSQNCNWFQGMRNFQSSCAHVGVGKTIAKVFENLSGDLYYDFLVHSDDFAAVIGYVEYTKFDAVTRGDDFWLYKANVSTDELEDFLIRVVKMVYNLNNLRISEKKSSISKNTVEFVSYINVGGSVYLGHEKHLFSMFSEKTGKGPRSDLTSLISQAYGALSKGSPSFVVDAIMDRALERLRHDYSMADGMIFDPVKYFEVDRDSLPLCFLPDLSRTALEYCLSKPTLHEVFLIKNYDFKRLHGDLTEKDMNAIKLLFVMSKFLMGKTNNVEIENIDIRDSSLIGDIRFKGKNDPEIREKLGMTKWLDEDILRLIAILDESTAVASPRDLLMSLVMNHLKLFSNDVVAGLSSRNKLQLMRLKADFKNKEYCALPCMSTYTTLREVYHMIKKFMTLTTNEEALKGLEHMSKSIDTVKNPDIAKMKFFIETTYRMSSRRVPTSKTIVKSPRTDIYKNFHNRTKDVIYYTLFKHRFDIENVTPVVTALLQTDSVSLMNFLHRFGYFDDLLPQEKRAILSDFVKNSPDIERSMVFVSSLMRGIPSVNLFLRHMLTNNLHPEFRMIMDTSNAGHLASKIMDQPLRVTKEVEMFLEELSVATALQIKNKDLNLKVQVPYIDDDCTLMPVKEALKRLRLEYAGYLGKMRTRCKRMYAFMSYHHLNDLLPMEECSKDDFFLKFVPEEQQYRKADPFKNIKVLVIRDDARIAFDFDSNSNLTVYTNWRDNKTVSAHARFFWRYTSRGGFNLDNYKYDMKGFSDYSSFLVGREGTYDVLHKAAITEEFANVIGRINVGNDGEKIIPKLTVDPNELMYEYCGKNSGSIAFRFLSFQTMSYKVELDDTYADTDYLSAFRDGIIDAYLRRKTEFISEPYLYFKPGPLPNDLYDAACTILERLTRWYRRLDNLIIKDSNEIPLSEKYVDISSRLLKDIEVEEDFDDDYFANLAEDEGPGNPISSGSESDSRSSSPSRSIFSGRAEDDDQIFITDKKHVEGRMLRTAGYDLSSLRDWLILNHFGNGRCGLSLVMVGMVLDEQIGEYDGVEIRRPDFNARINDSSYPETTIKELLYSREVLEYFMSNAQLDEIPNSRAEVNKMIREVRILKQDYGIPEQIQTVVDSILRLVDVYIPTD
uniref:RNA-directed RNA polymerase L n=1 Tax=Coleopteran hanta-related virus OKIAV221 TaxID=2746358 RepID=A0A7D7J441_9VIRU|nr:RNA-dependent RNA polymerase [Coleopteran hanta-related virus OKIAV221]